MTISSEISTAGPYSGNGVTTIFPYGFRIVDETHIRVVLQDPFGDSTDLSLVGGDYTVSGVGNDDGGNITVVVAPLVGYKLTLLRNPPFTQETDLANQGPYSAEVVEDRFDMVVMQIQAVNEKTGRAITVAPGQTPPSADLIEAAQANAEAAAASAQAAGESAQDAAESAALASEFANNPEDIEVLPGRFSAFHFMKKAQAAFASVIAGFAASIHGATAKSPMIDTDELGFWDSVSGDLRKITLANFVTSLFVATRTIANATFAGASVRFRNAATAFYQSFDTTALTANRVFKFADRATDMASLGWELIQEQNAVSGSASVDFVDKLTSAFDEYELVISRVQLSASANLNARVAVAGTSWLTSYDVAYIATANSTSPPGGQVTANPVYNVSVSAGVAAAVDQITATLKIVREVLRTKMIASGTYLDNGSTWRGVPLTVGVVGSLAGSIQLIPASGTITAMRAQLYGRRKG